MRLPRFSASVFPCLLLPCLVSFSPRVESGYEVEQNEVMSMGTEPQLLHRTTGLAAVILDAGSTVREQLTQAGQLCVRKAVAELEGSARGDIVYTELGAPEWTYARMNDHVQSGVQISIAHTGSVAVGVASMTAVGVDLERSDRDVSRLFHGLNEQERRLIPRYSVLEILCAKEAAGKAQNVGLAGSIKRWLVSEVAGQLRVTDQGDLDGVEPHIWSIDIVNTHVGSTALTCVIAAP